MPQRAERSDCPHLCLVCGLDYARPDEYHPWGESGTEPTFDYCDCCGVEFGYGDATLEAVRNTRQKWIDSGSPWNNPDRQPHDWLVDEQLRRLPDRAK